jgi:hypothetical protein
VVWAVLTDFRNYPLWDPIIQISGTPVLGAVLTCAVRIRNKLRPIPGEASITQFEEAKKFAWTLGIKPLLSITERYTITPVGEGSEVLHQLEISGWGTGVFRFFMRDRIDATLRTAQLSLTRRAEQVPQSRSGLKPKGRGLQRT